MNEKLYTTKELAEALRVDIRVIYRMRDEGKLQYIRAGRHYRYVMPKLTTDIPKE